MTLLEVVISMVIISLMVVGVIQSLLHAERFAATARLLTNARAIVQRNLSTAMEVGLLTTGTSSLTPVVLQNTPADGSVCDDDGGSPTENISVLLSGTASGTVTSGTMRRIVSLFPFTDAGITSGSSVLRITFQVDYDYRSKHYTYSQTTLRATDSQ